MTEEKAKRTIKVHHHSAGGMVWFIGWLFTIGFSHLSFMKAVWAILLWPYYLGSSVSG